MDKYQEVQRLYDNPYLYEIEFKDYHDDMYFWPQIVQGYNSKNLLEIGCGIGRVAKLVAPVVEKYTGLDFSKEFIDYFKEKEKKFISQYNISLINQDMKKIHINEKYDMIILPFNVFVYLYTDEDIKNFFLGLEKVCSKNTIIIIDLANNQEEDFININYRLCNEINDLNNRKIKLYEKHTYDEDNKIIYYSKKYISDDEKQEVILNLPVKVYTVDDFVRFAKQYNYKFEIVYGDYDKSDYSKNSRKQIIVLKKR